MISGYHCNLHAGFFSFLDYFPNTRLERILHSHESQKSKTGQFFIFEFSHMVFSLSHCQYPQPFPAHLQDNFAKFFFDFLGYRLGHSVLKVLL